jgi:hypothetical protein
MKNCEVQRRSFEKETWVKRENSVVSSRKNLSLSFVVPSSAQAEALFWGSRDVRTFSVVNVGTSEG